MRRIQVQIAVLLTLVALVAGTLALVVSSASAQRPTDPAHRPAAQSIPPPPAGGYTSTTDGPSTNPGQAAPSQPQLPAMPVGTPCGISTTIQGTLAAGDGTIPGGRLFRDAIPAVCGTPKTFPGTSGTGPFYYDAYTFTNNSGAPQCVTASLFSAACNVELSVYLTSFDPNNVATNYLADAGSSTGAGGTVAAGFTIPAGADFVVVVNDPNSGLVGCGAYTLAVGGCAVGGTATPTPTGSVPTATATRTATAAASPTCSAGGGGTPGPWRTSTPTPPSRYRAGAASDGTYIYIYGGSNSVAAYLNDLWRWNPATEAWTQLANMPTGKSNIQGTYWNGKIYVPGGYTGAHINENAIYDIASNTWTTGAPLPATQSGQTAAYNGKIYNIGGNPGPQTTVSIYDIATNTWSTGAALPVANTYGRAITVGSYIYYVGGITTVTVGTVYRYDPVANSWATMAPLQTARTSTELATNGTYIFAMGGGDATFFTGVPLAQSVEIYNIATDTWTYGNPLVAKVAAPSGGGVTGGKVMLDNGVDGATYPVTVQVADVSGGAPCASPTPGSTSTPTRTATSPPVTATRTGVPSSTVTAQAATSTATATPVPTTCPVQFVDVPSGSTFYAFIRCLACRGIVGGYACGGPGEPCPGNYYRPNNNVTRGQVAKIVSESAGFNDVIPSTQQTFEDVAPGSTFALWVERLAGRGIIGGYPCGGPFEPCVAPGNRPYFRPNNNVTRGQLSKITSGAAGWTETPTSQTFEDAPPASTFYLWIERMASRGIISGYACGGPFEPCVAPGNRPYFRPNNNATRGQMAKIAASAFFPNCSTPAVAPSQRSPDSATP